MRFFTLNLNICTDAQKRYCQIMYIQQTSYSVEYIVILLKAITISSRITAYRRCGRLCILF